MNERFGKNLVAQVLSGSQVKKVLDLHFDDLSTYGIMKSMSQKNIVSLIDYLTATGYLQADGGQFPVLKITASGFAVLKGQQKVTRKTAVHATKSLPQNDELFEELRQLRREFAEKQGVPPFVIFSDKTLHEMSAVMPATAADMLNVKGVGESKMEKYGKQFLEVISKYQDDQASDKVKA